MFNSIFCCLPCLKGGKWLQNLDKICPLKIANSEMSNFYFTSLPRMALYLGANFWLILISLVFTKVKQNYEIWKCLVIASGVPTLISDAEAYDFLAVLFFIWMKKLINIILWINLIKAFNGNTRQFRKSVHT